MELVNPESEHVKEMAKWEQFPCKWTLGSQPGSPWTMRPYPWMLYKAKQMANGKWAVADEAPAYYGFRDAQEWDRACQGVAAFNTACQRIVNSQAEHEQARRDGWRDDPTEAIAWRAGLEKDVSNAAAERAASDAKMSDKARAEVAAIEADTFGHVADIPTSDKRRDALAKARQAKADKRAAEAGA